MKTEIEYAIGEFMPGTKWVVRGQLGQGGMGLVLDVMKGRLIPGAMKVLLPSFAVVPEFAERFLEEVKVTARLRHPNIVQVLDFDRLEDGTPFMVMERLRGRTLRAALRETRQRGQTWTAANTYAVASQVSEGLYRAHAQVPSIVHRDVKPENVYLHRAEASLESVVKVMDFGVAAVVGQCGRQSIGTPRYMAPEQVEGDAVTPQTDQYALAVVIYEMLTGRLPWDVDARDASALANAHRHLAPTPAARFCAWLPQVMDAALLKALSKDPAARHDTVHGLIFELRDLQWIGDHSSSTALDANSTDPSMGTLADGGVVVHEEPDTFDRMSVPPVDGASLEVPALTSASVMSVHLSELCDDGSTGVASDADPEARREVVSGSGSPVTGNKPIDVTPAVQAPHAIDAGGAAHSARGSALLNRGKVSRNALRKVSLALVGSAALVAVLVGDRIAHSPRDSDSKAANLVEPEEAAIGGGADDPELAPARLPGEAVALAEDSSAPPSRGSWTQPWVTAAASPPPPNVAGSSVPKVPLPPRQPLRGLSMRVPIPDDGRDELYVPVSR